MRAAFGKNVDPDILKHQIPPAKIKRQILGKCRHMRVQRLYHGGKDWKPPRKIGE